MERDSQVVRSSTQRPVQSGEGAILPQLLDVLRRERQAAEATLGRKLFAPYAFAADCLFDGLGHALNAEQDRIDETRSAAITKKTSNTKGKKEFHVTTSCTPAN